MAKPLRWYINRVEQEFERVQSAHDRMVFENRYIEPYDETRRCAFSDARVRTEIRPRNVIRQGIIARYAGELADYHAFCERTLGIDPDFHY
jgi:hypothetical protein